MKNKNEMKRNETANQKPNYLIEKKILETRVETGKALEYIKRVCGLKRENIVNASLSLQLL